MLEWAVVFVVVALIAAVFGFTGLAVGAAAAAKVVFVTALVLAAASLLYRRRPAA